MADRKLLLLKKTSKIYGVSWDGGESPVLTRTDSSVGMIANAGIDANPVSNDFDNAEILKK